MWGRGRLFASLENIVNEDQNEMFVRRLLYPIFVLVTNHIYPILISGDYPGNDDGGLGRVYPTPIPYILHLGVGRIH